MGSQHGRLLVGIGVRAKVLGKKKSEKMLNKNEDKRAYTFSQPKLYLSVIKHGGKICLAVLILMLLIAIINNKEISDIGRSIHVIIFLGILIFLTGRLLRKFAHKINVDFELQHIEFFMNRGREVVKADFNDVTNIRVNGYITFVLKTRKIFYSGAPNEEILICLSKIKKIQWGILCALLGPSKNLRDAVERA